MPSEGPAGRAMETERIPDGLAEPGKDSGSGRTEGCGHEAAGRVCQRRPDFGQALKGQNRLGENEVSSHPRWMITSGLTRKTRQRRRGSYGEGRQPAVKPRRLQGTGRDRSPRALPEPTALTGLQHAQGQGTPRDEARTRPARQGRCLQFPRDADPEPRRRHGNRRGHLWPELS